ncbi:PREDICTED: serine protease HTRA2, mitochondrial-like [Priapulus caudatus]|uniref:Serine protease HTRA2, mitochondrial n=1 Tax=Priapulus caudatus TaxID=37621 RepID=A0ABM1EQP9_PRICU|nr:PREDICTED: serine protease HTRA2, mitochondrial-like [Priapulus caudatus]
MAALMRNINFFNTSAILKTRYSGRLLHTPSPTNFTRNIGTTPLNWLRLKQASTGQKIGIFGVGLLSGFVIASNVGKLSPQQKPDVGESTLLPVLRAAQVYDEGTTGHDDQPKSRRLNFIADVVDQAVPSVVYIEIRGRHPFTGHDVTLSNGSGFIVRSDGVVLTNAHVVGNNREVVVRLHDGREVTGRVQYLDPTSDLATVRVDAGHDLPAMRLGRSADVRPGEWVVAVGSPLTLSNTITAGIVSTAARGSSELGLGDKNMEYIQTDAAITFGNSGGPLVNLDGEAIGINTMKVAVGISFAIPIDHAKQFLEEVSRLEERDRKTGWFGKKKHPSGERSPAEHPLASPRRRYMGITMLTLTPNIVGELRLRDTRFPDVEAGVLVHRIVVGSPAHRGGLEVGDVVVAIDGHETRRASDIYDVLQTGRKDLVMTVVRGSRSLRITVTPEDVEF